MKQLPEYLSKWSNLSDILFFWVLQKMPQKIVLSFNLPFLNGGESLRFSPKKSEATLGCSLGASHAGGMSSATNNLWRGHLTIPKKDFCAGILVNVLKDMSEK